MTDNVTPFRNVRAEELHRSDGLRGTLMYQTPFAV
jgi:hypothetical protein